MKKKLAFYFCSLEIRQSDYEHSYRFVGKTHKDIEKAADDVARHWYSGSMEVFEEGVYSFNCDDVMVSVEKIQEISKEEYDIMSKYI